MQMFEDAITRWRHSRTCKGSAKINREKDLNGQVIQLYVKPDKVSYQHNNIPGKNIVNYRPHIKKNSAELKCMICRRRFLSLDDIREHVKYPCRRVYDKSPNLSDSENIASDFDDIEDPTLIKIRRVEFTQNKEPVPTTGTGLSVLAEASKHIESLLSYNNNLQNNLGRQLRDSDLQHFIPELSAHQLSEELEGEPKELTNTFGIKSEEPVVSEPPPLILQRKKHLIEVLKHRDVEPVVIVFQQEDGQIIPVDLLDPETVHSYISDTAASLPTGQIVQVQLGDNRVQNYVKRPGGEIIPVEIIPTIRLNSEKKQPEEVYTNSSHLVQEQVEISAATEPNQSGILQRSTPPPQNTTANQTSVLGPTQSPTVSSLLKSSLSLAQNLLLDAGPTLQNPVAFLQNLEVLNVDYTGQVSPTSVEVSTETKDEGTSLEETIEEHGYFLPSEQESIL